MPSGPHPSAFHKVGSMKRWRSCLIVLLLIAALAIALVAFYYSPYNFLAGPGRTQLAISAPSDGAAIALHSTLPVVAEADSSVGVRSLQLWVNGQLWSETRFVFPQNKVRQVWPWTPSGEGTHALLLRSMDAYGWTSESQLVNVYASAGFDVRFPLPYTARAGDTLASLATELGSDPQAVAESNPGIGLNSPLASGQQLIIPVPIPNTGPAAPASGEPPEPPAAPLPPPSAGGGPGDQPPAAGQTPGGGLSLKVPVQEIYAYVSLAGGPWMRIPQGDFNFLPVSGDTFDVGPYLTPQLLAGLNPPVSFYAQVWGWSGGNLVYLGDQTGTLGVSPLQGRAITSTKLSIVGRIRDSVSFESEWTIPRPIPDYYQGYKQGFQWTVSVPGVTQGVWQVATQPFPADATFGVPGFVGAGPLAGPKTILSQVEALGIPIGPVESEVMPTQFQIDFANYLKLPAGASGLQGWLDALSGKSTLHRRDGSLPTTFYIRVLPVLGSKLGTPSNTVVVHYGPAIPEPVTAETGPIYDVQVLSFTPYRAANPKYSACMILQKDLQYCNPSYSLDPVGLSELNLHMQNVLKSAQQSGTLQYYKSQFPGVVIEKPKCYTSFPKGTLSCGCPGVSCSSGSSCSASPADWGNCAEWAFNQVKHAAGWISEKFEDLKNYAVDAVMKYTGIGKVCEALKGADECRAALKAALEYGLASLGVPPTVPNLETLMSEGKDYMAQMAIQELKDQGIACDSACEAAIKGGVNELTKGASFDTDTGGGGATGGYQLNWQPAPQGLEQPASMAVRVTRRPETAGIPTEDTGVCSLMVWNGAVNSLYGVKLEGAPFIGVGMDIPPMQPGASLVIPVVFQRLPWNAPNGLTLKTTSGGSIQPPNDPDYGAWSLLYYGSTTTFDLRGSRLQHTGSGRQDGQGVLRERSEVPEHCPGPLMADMPRVVLFYRALEERA